MYQTFRHATEADLALIMPMVDHSRSLMRAAGNLTQWVGYPTEADILADIRAHSSYLLLRDSIPVATFALLQGDEPTYAYIDHGRWITPHLPYSTLHRMACREGQHGIADAIFNHVCSRHDYLRADTHADNRAMLHLLEKHAFVAVGTVSMDDGSPRTAYEWWAFPEVDADLKAYVEASILPQYAHFDAAHRIDHARRVIARAMPMANAYGIAPNLAYAAAAMHDIGLARGREQHHVESGRMIRANASLARWFTPDEVELLAQAAEDHRASATTKPRSPLGCIIAEADRDIEPLTILRRTIAYGLSHFPSLSREEQYLRTLDHLHEKYHHGGYIKLWLPDSPNLAPLSELRDLIDSPARLRSLFDDIFTSLNTPTL